MSTNDIVLSGAPITMRINELVLDHVAVTDGVLSLAYQFSHAMQDRLLNDPRRAAFAMNVLGVRKRSYRTSHRPASGWTWQGVAHDKRLTKRAVRAHRWQQLRDTGRLPLKGCDPLAVVCPGVHPSRYRWWTTFSLSLRAGRLP